MRMKPEGYPRPMAANKCFAAACFKIYFKGASNSAGTFHTGLVTALLTRYNKHVYPCNGHLSTPVCVCIKYSHAISPFIETRLAPQLMAAERADTFEESQS